MPHDDRPPSARAALLLTLRGAILEADPEWAELVGVPVLRLERSEVWRHLPDEDRQLLSEAIDRIVRGHGQESLRLRIRTPAGSALTVEAELVPAPPTVSGAPMLRLHLRGVRRVTPAVVYQAWRQGRVSLHAQPIRDAATGAIVRRELLARLSLRSGPPVPGAEFVPLVERLGLAGEFDAWVVARAVALLAAGAPVPLELNVTAATVTQGDAFVGALEAQLARRRQSGRRLTVALPGAAVVRAPEAAARFAALLRATGVAVAIDHVGGSTTDLTVLAGLPFDTIKIDARAVPAGAAGDAALDAIARLVEAVHDAGAEAVATAVGDGVVATQMRETGMDALQGHALGMPVPVGHT